MHLGVDHKTTWFGAAGEGLKALAVFVPPPFNLVPLGLGACCSAIAFFFAQDRTMTKEPPHMDVKKLLVLLVASGVLFSGCTNTTTATRALAHGVITSTCNVAHQAVDVGLAPIDDVQHDAAATVNTVTGTSK